MLSNDVVWAMAIKGRPVFKNLDTEFTIDYGCKIERNVDTGELTFYNCRLGGDFYKKIEDTELFFTEGFDIAALTIGINTLKENEEVESVKQKISAYEITRDYIRHKGGYARG